MGTPEITTNPNQTTGVEDSKIEFAIKIDFEKGAGNPSRAFRAMSDLIDAFQETDKVLVKSIDNQIDPVILLEDVTGSSIKAWLRQSIESIDDEGLKKGEYKIIIGKYLIKAKYLIVDFLHEKSNIRGLQEVQQLEGDLFRLAEETNVRALPFYSPVSRKQLLGNIEKINSALGPLNETDKAILSIPDREDVNFNLSLNISPETIEELLTARILPTRGPMILLIKKPDFLGQSQWEFKWSGRTFPAKILDAPWLENYHNGKFTLVPGDAIQADVLTEVSYGYNNEVIATHYSVLTVDEIIHQEESNQANLFSNIDEDE
jgi:hypothetical protein